jgi:hypothetical protein
MEADQGLAELLTKARDLWDSMPPAARAEMERQQRRSWIAAEMAIGDDIDEAAYRAAHEAGDAAELARLQAEGEVRRQAAFKYMDEHGI